MKLLYFGPLKICRNDNPESSAKVKNDSSEDGQAYLHIVNTLARTEKYNHSGGFDEMVNGNEMNELPNLRFFRGYDSHASTTKKGEIIRPAKPS